jgi:L-lactate dehydrogenase complex protein LldG
VTGGTSSPGGTGTGATGRTSSSGGTGVETGDRGAFLATARQRLAGDIFTNPVHVPPPTPPPSAPVPRPGYRNLDPDDLVATFVAAVAHAEGTCHVVSGADIAGGGRGGPGGDPAGAGDDDGGGAGLDGLLDDLVAELGDRSVVVSAEPGARDLGRRLAARGVTVADATVERAAAAGLGVTGAVAAVAATGSLVLDSRAAGGRSASLLPTVHLCVVSVNTLVAAPADVLRRLGSAVDALPPSLVLVTGPSRTGDIEQLLTLGAHGPTALHVVLVTDGASGASTSSS